MKSKSNRKKASHKPIQEHELVIKFRKKKTAIEGYKAPSVDGEQSQQTNMIDEYLKEDTAGQF